MIRDLIEVRDCEPDERDEALTVLVEAFREYGPVRLLLGEKPSDRQLRRLQAPFAMDLEQPLIGAFVDQKLVGVLSYLDSPGCNPHGWAAARFFASLLLASGWRLPRAMITMGKAERLHVDIPHRHLPSIGVHPAARGLGVGAALLREFTDRADGDGSRLSYLESASTGPIPLLERHGFVVVDEVPMTPAFSLVSMQRPSAE